MGRRGVRCDGWVPFGGYSGRYWRRLVMSGRAMSCVAAGEFGRRIETCMHCGAAWVAEL